MTSQLAEPDQPRHTGPARELLQVLPAVPDSLRLARAALTEWLDLLWWPADDADDLILAVSEAVTNVIEHAYPPAEPGPLRLHAWCSSGSSPSTRRVTVAVTDRGAWGRGHRFSGPASYRGHGLAVMSGCTAEMHVQRSAGGTSVVLVSNDARSIGRLAPNPRGAEAPQMLARGAGVLHTILNRA